MTKAEINQRKETPNAMETPILTLSFPDGLLVEEGVVAAGAGAVSLVGQLLLVINVYCEDVAFWEFSRLDLREAWYCAIADSTHGGGPYWPFRGGPLNSVAVWKV